MSFDKKQLAGCCLLAGTLFGFLVSNLCRRGNSCQNTRKAHFDLIVTVTLKDESCTSKFLEQFRELQRHCHREEENTVTYEIFRKEVEEGENAATPVFVIVERYTDKVALTEVHHKSAAFLQFATWLNTSGVLLKKERARGDVV